MTSDDHPPEAGGEEAGAPPEESRKAQTVVEAGPALAEALEAPAESAAESGLRSFFTRRRIIAAAAALFFFLILGGCALNWVWRAKREPSGGLYFFRKVELGVPIFRQGDPAWRNERLGNTDGTLAAEGCAVSSLAMVFKYYGIDTDPKRLNDFLTGHDGYIGQGWLCWDKAPALAPGRVKHLYEDLPSYFLIDWNLMRGNPVIVRLRLKNGITHFVVIAGKSGFDYLIRDPGAGWSKGLYPLREIGSPIEALRYYKSL